MPNVCMVAQLDGLQHNGMLQLAVKQKCMCEIWLREEGLVKTIWKQVPHQDRSTLLESSDNVWNCQTTEGKTMQKLTRTSDTKWRLSGSTYWLTELYEYLKVHQAIADIHFKHCALLVGYCRIYTGLFSAL